MKYHLRVNGDECEVEFQIHGGKPSLRVDGEAFDLEYHEVDALGQVLAISEGRSHAVSVEGDQTRMGITIAGHYYAIEIENERERAARAASGGRGNSSGIVNSVMPGIVIEVLVEAGQHVERGAPLLILEAMKMQNEIDAPISGCVEAVHVEAGKTVSGGDKLVSIRSVDE